MSSKKGSGSSTVHREGSATIAEMESNIKMLNRDFEDLLNSSPYSITQGAGAIDADNIRHQFAIVCNNIRRLWQSN